MISGDYKWLLIGTLLFFSLPACIMIVLFYGEVMPYIAKNGLNFIALDKIFYISMASLIMGFVIEAMLAMILSEIKK